MRRHHQWKPTAMPMLAITCLAQAANDIPHRATDEIRPLMRLTLSPAVALGDFFGRQNEWQFASPKLRTCPQNREVLQQTSSGWHSRIAGENPCSAERGASTIPQQLLLPVCMRTHVLSRF